MAEALFRTVAVKDRHGRVTGTKEVALYKGPFPIKFPVMTRNRRQNGYWRESVKPLQSVALRAVSSGGRAPAF